MPLKHFRDKFKRTQRTHKQKKISVTDYPIDIWYQILLFVEEADRRKVSVCCSFFNSIFQTFPSFFKAPFDLWIHCDLSYPIPIFSTLNRFLSYDNDNNEIIWYGNNYNIDQKLFKQTGPQPCIVVSTDKGNHIVNFDDEFKIHCTSKTTTKITIEKMFDCKLWFNRKYEGVYYVPGCSFKELDFAKKKKDHPIFDYYHGILTQLTNQSPEVIMRYQPKSQRNHRKENEQFQKSIKHTVKKNHTITNHNVKRQKPKNPTNHQKHFR
jgi:hypothetical protein